MHTPPCPWSFFSVAPPLLFSPCVCRGANKRSTHLGIVSSYILQQQKKDQKVRQSALFGVVCSRHCSFSFQPLTTPAVFYSCDPRPLFSTEAHRGPLQIGCQPFFSILRVPSALSLPGWLSVFSFFSPALVLLSLTLLLYLGIPDHSSCHLFTLKCAFPLVLLQPLWCPSINS